MTILNITLVLEALLLLIATFWSQFAGIKLLTQFVLHRRNILIGLGAGISMSAISFFLLWLAKFDIGSFKWLKSLRDIAFSEVAPIFAPLNFIDILLIAITSGFCEEIFFRGVLQPQIGVIATGIVFGFFHCPSLRHISYGLWATLAGLFLGWLLMSTHSLWVPIFAHSLNNLISLLFLRYKICCQPLTSENTNHKDEKGNYL